MDGNARLSTDDIKKYNRLIVLQNVFRSFADGTSQSQVSKLTGLSEPSVFRSFMALEKAGLISVKDQKKERSKIKGRKPTLYTLKPDAFYTITVEISRYSLYLSLFNFRQEILHHIEYTLDVSQYDADSITKEIVELTNSVLDKFEIEKAKFIGVAIACPGTVDTENGIVLHYGRIQGMQDYNLREKLEAELDCIVIVRNNAAVNTYYEQTYNKEYEGSMFAVILRHGISGAFCENRKLLRDSKGYSIDVGHLAVAPTGPKCTCGESACLEAFLLNMGGEYDENILMNLDKLLTTDLALLDKITDEIVKYLLVLLKNINRMVNPDSYLILAKSGEVAAIIANKILKHSEKKIPRYKNDIGKPVYSAAYNIEKGQKALSELILYEYFKLYHRNLE